jgi:hypothetical protein
MCLMKAFVSISTVFYDQKYQSAKYCQIRCYMSVITLGLGTFSKMTFNINGLFVLLELNDSINDTQHNYTALC